MAEISRVALFGKLNSLGYKAIESATVFCKPHWKQAKVLSQGPPPPIAIHSQCSA